MQESDLVRLFLYDRKTREHKNIFEAADRSVDSYEWAPDSRSLYVTFEDKGQEPLARLDIATMKLTPLVMSGTSADVDVSRDGAFLVFSKMDLSHAANLFRLNLSSAAGTAIQLTQMNLDVLKEIEFGEVSSFEFRGWNSETVQAWQIKPPQFDANKKYPLLLLMHGGPENDFDNLFHYRWNAQLFAAAGYVVIEPSFHGSSGFGLKFMDSIKGQWGGAPYEDDMIAVDTALEWPYIDATRIAAAGGSYGGYMANWIEGHTDRFRAIVSHDGLFDLTTMLYSTDFVGGDNAGVQRHGMGKSARFDRPGASHIRQELQNPNVNYSRWQRLSRRSESGFCDVSSASGEACPVKTAVLRKRKPLGA